MLVGRVVRYDVDDYFDACRMCGFGEMVEVVHGAEFRVDVAVVVHIVSAVCQLRRIERLSQMRPRRVFLDMGFVVRLLRCLRGPTRLCL